LDSQDRFLDELSKQFDRELDLKNSLENKSSYLLTVSGIIIPLIFGFGIFMIEKIPSDYHFLAHVQVILILVLVSNLVSIIFAVMAAKIRDYSFPVLHDKFVKFEKKKPIIIETEVKKYSSAKKEVLDEMLIEEYLKSNSHNFNANESKAFYIKSGQTVLLGSLALIPILVYILVYYPPTLF
jgi:hypothetical protein